MYLSVCISRYTLPPVYAGCPRANPKKNFSTQTSFLLYSGLSLSVYLYIPPYPNTYLNTPPAACTQAVHAQSQTSVYGHALTRLRTTLPSFYLCTPIYTSPSICISKPAPPPPLPPPLCTGCPHSNPKKKLRTSFNFPSVNPHRRFIYRGDTSTHAQGTDPGAPLGAEEELP